MNLFNPNKKLSERQQKKEELAALILNALKSQSLNKADMVKIALSEGYDSSCKTLITEVLEELSGVEIVYSTKTDKRYGTWSLI